MPSLIIFSTICFKTKPSFTSKAASFSPGLVFRLAASLSRKTLNSDINLSSFASLPNTKSNDNAASSGTNFHSSLQLVRAEKYPNAVIAKWAKAQCRSCNSM
ncbi:hypothetical protein Hanom_Chr13g01242741 [Helianthus anomalus]